MCAGTDTEVHLIIFTRARNACEEIKDREEKKNGNCRRKKMAGSKRLLENRKTKKDTRGIYHKQRRVIVDKGELL